METDDEEDKEETPLLFNIAQNATSCANVVEWMSEAETRAVILGDISGSMGGYDSTRMQSLRKSFKEQAEAVEKKGGKFALIAWCSWLQWCPNIEWNLTQGTSWRSAVDRAVDGCTVGLVTCAPVVATTCGSQSSRQC